MKLEQVAHEASGLVLCNHASAACGPCPHATPHQEIWYSGDDLEPHHGNANCLDEEYCHYVHTVVICKPISADILPLFGKEV